MLVDNYQLLVWNNTKHKKQKHYANEKYKYIYTCIYICILINIKYIYFF